MASIRIETGPTKGAEYIMTSPTISIGRKSSCDVIIGDVKSSREHCQVSVDGDGYIIKDMNSRNGTYLNGEKMEGQTGLYAGDRIRIGTTVMTFLLNTGGQIEGGGSELGDVVELEEVESDFDAADDVVDLDEIE